MAVTPILNGLMQSDLDANGFRILNLVGSDAVQSGTIYVDPEAEPGTGVIDSASPFDNLEDALAVAPAGYNIIMRPAVYQFDGHVTVERQVNILGYGAVLAPLTPGGSCGITVNASRTKIIGLTFDADIEPLEGTNASVGCITIFGANNVLLKDIEINDQNGDGIELQDRYDYVKIENCTFNNCFRGITGAIGSTSITNTSIRGCLIKANRHAGISLVGIDNAGGVALRDVRIQNNEFIGNDTAGENKPAINITNGVVDLLISGNYISGHYDSIVVYKVLRGAISDNVLTACTHNHISVLGHQKVNITGNIIDGAASNGVATALRGIRVALDYLTTDDSGPMVISGNVITSIHATGESIHLENVNDIDVIGNKLQRMNASSFAGVLIAANDFSVINVGPAIVLDAAERGSSGATISANRFRIFSAPSRLISVLDLTSTGISNIFILANSSTTGITYSAGIVSSGGGDDATNVHITANVPPSVSGDSREGWVNDDTHVLYNQVIVSQSRGMDSVAQRQSDASPYLTINAAIAAAADGDTVYVQDGVFNELITAKDGVTVRFLPAATLECTTANGCIISTTDGEQFSLYHEHAPIKTSKAGQIAVTITDSGVYHIHANIENTGANTGQLAHGLGIGGDSSASVNIYGSIYSANGFAISTLGTGDPTIRCHPVARPYGIVSSTPYLYSASSVALSVSRGQIIVDGFWIFSGGNVAISIPTATSTQWFKRCTIQTNSTGDAAVDITASAPKIVPLFRDCIIISEDTATQSIDCNAAQDITVMGTVIGNKGADPPTNVTFQGGGTYVVDADAVGDFA